MTTLLLTHPVCIEHDTGVGHPERPDRLRAIEQVLAHEYFHDLKREEAPRAEKDHLTLCHPRNYVDAIEAATPRNGLTQVDADTVMSPKSWEAALRAAGSGIEAVDRVMTGKVQNAFCAVRPPGHHAENDKAMGFCLFSNAAIAAHYARKEHEAERVAVVDFDVHHGNGTQDIFWSDKNLFYGSTHQMPLFPGTGAIIETGVGNIFNAPLRSGDGALAFRDAMNTRILGPLAEFKPDLLIISAGFDAHKDDPLASLELIESDFDWATYKLADIADKYCGGRIVSMLEGGYNLQALAQSVGVHVRALMDAGN